MQVYNMPEVIEGKWTDKYGHVDDMVLNDDRRYDMQASDARREAFLKELADELRNEGYTGKLTGHLFRQGWADGYAEYMVVQTRTGAISLTWLPVGDAWRLPAAFERGLTSAEVKRFVTAPSLFGERVRY